MSEVELARLDGIAAAWGLSRAATLRRLVATADVQGLAPVDVPDIDELVAIAAQRRGAATWVRCSGWRHGSRASGRAGARTGCSPGWGRATGDHGGGGDVAGGVPRPRPAGGPRRRALGRAPRRCARAPALGAFLGDQGARYAPSCPSAPTSRRRRAPHRVVGRSTEARRLAAVGCRRAVRAGSLAPAANARIPLLYRRYDTQGHSEYRSAGPAARVGGRRPRQRRAHTRGLRPHP